MPSFSIGCRSHQALPILLKIRGIREWYRRSDRLTTDAYSCSMYMYNFLKVYVMLADSPNLVRQYMILTTTAKVTADKTVIITLHNFHTTLSIQWFSRDFDTNRRLTDSGVSTC